MADYVAILDSVGYIDDKGQPVYVERGQDVPVSGDEAARLLDPEVHPPFGAIAKKGTTLATKLSQPVSTSVNPDMARRDRAALAEAEVGANSGTLDPAGKASDEPVTGVDAGVTYSRQVAAEQEARAEAEKTLSDAAEPKATPRSTKRSTGKRGSAKRAASGK